MTLDAKPSKTGFPRFLVAEAWPNTHPDPMPLLVGLNAVGLPVFLVVDVAGSTAFVECEATFGQQLDHTDGFRE